MEMVGISRKYWILLAASLLAFSCTKELEQGMPESVRGDYDPVVRFGLETYVGADEPLTKTTYAGDDQTYLLNSVRYERINWNVESTDPYIDVVQVRSENVFTKNNQTAVDYKAVKIPVQVGCRHYLHNRLRLICQTPIFHKGTRRPCRKQSE